MSTVRKPHPIARIFSIDKTTYEVAPESEDEYTSLEEIADELPDHAPRFVLLSYPVTRGDGRKATPYVLLAWVSFYRFPERVGRESKKTSAIKGPLRREKALEGDKESVDGYFSW